MTVAHFLFNQILALPTKDLEEFMKLWEENKKQFEKNKKNKKNKKVPLLTSEDLIAKLKKRGIWN